MVYMAFIVFNSLHAGIFSCLTFFSKKSPKTLLGKLSKCDYNSLDPDKDLRSVKVISR